MGRTLQQLAPDVAALAEFAFRESRCRKWLPSSVTFESWLISTIFERTDLLVQHGFISGEERERFVFVVRPILSEDGLTIYLEA